MPLALPIEVMLSKILANGLVILLAAGLSLTVVVQWWLGVPIAGSLTLFLARFIVLLSRRLAFFSARSQPRSWS